MYLTFFFLFEDICLLRKWFLQLSSSLEIYIKYIFCMFFVAYQIISFKRSYIFPAAPTEELRYDIKKQK